MPPCCSRHMLSAAGAGSCSSSAGGIVTAFPCGSAADGACIHSGSARAKQQPSARPEAQAVGRAGVWLGSKAVQRLLLQLPSQCCAIGPAHLQCRLPPPSGRRCRMSRWRSCGGAPPQRPPQCGLVLASTQRCPRPPSKPRHACMHAPARQRRWRGPGSAWACAGWWSKGTSAGTGGPVVATAAPAAAPGAGTAALPAASATAQWPADGSGLAGAEAVGHGVAQGGQV